LKSRTVLDTWAVISMLDDGPGAVTVAEAVDGGRAAMSWINLGEVEYILRRRVGATAAAGVVADIRNTVAALLPDVKLIREAAAIKAAVAMSYADCFAAATSYRLNAPVLTGDPELLSPPSELTARWTYVDLRRMR
jgi:predicted nucleic acid-binding protein